MSGPDCRCSKLKCFQNVSARNRVKIISELNFLGSVDEQNSHLCGLISVQEIQKRTPRKCEEDASFREASYSYRVRFLDDQNILKEVKVCRKAFLSIYRIGKIKFEVLQKGL